MTVQNLYEEQFEELRYKLIFCYSADDLEATGANIDEWTDEDWSKWANASVCDPLRITDELVIKSFDGYDFGIDDFFCTAGQYDKYPDKE